jgi:predicted amidohydrolase YtcJ
LVISDNGKVIATGDSALLDDYPQATRIDATGRYVLPGLIDAHAHMFNLGYLEITLNLSGTPSVDDAVQQIADYAAANRYTDWILGRGWNQVLWPIKEFPKSSDIDAVVKDRPVWLRRIDGHAGWANSKAMHVAGINDNTPDPVGGKIVRDTSGKATGVLVDNAMSLLESHIPAPGKDEIRKSYRRAIRRVVSLGMTGVHDTGINTQEAEVYMSMADDGELDMRIYAMVSDAGKNLDAIGKPLIAYGGDKLEIAAVKLYSDGALGSRGAALLEPYSDDSENRGLPFWTAEKLLAFTKKANDMGFQVGIHAIGDLGNRMALDAFEEAQGGRHSDLRNRVEHAQIISLDDVPRFAELGVIASMQPTHATSDMNMAEDRLGPDRLKGGYAWRKLLDSGAVLASGSDFPVELPNPFYGLYAAVTRQDRNGMPEGGWYIEEGLTRAEALHSFTLAAAYAAHQEDRMGSLEPGKWADFIMVDRDYFTIPNSEIDDIQVIGTWVGGKRVFNASDGEQK